MHLAQCPAPEECLGWRVLGSVDFIGDGVFQWIISGRQNALVAAAAKRK